VKEGDKSSSSNAKPPSYIEDGITLIEKEEGDS
jgi:hypothetical protein